MSPVERLRAVMARLRDPVGGCPWDREQTFESIAPYTIEEAYEVADAIARHDFDALVDELGDLLFQVVFHAQMASEQGRFDFDDVAGAIVEKMERRHPHVFGEESIASVEEQRLAWEAHKATERGEKAGSLSVMDQVAGGLPALTRALKLQRKAATAGFDWAAAGEVLGKLEEELGELSVALETQSGAAAIARELGDLLFTCVNFARHAGIDPDSALRDANAKFERRFRALETFLQQAGSRPEKEPQETLDAIWADIKRDEQ